jgi:hypothetical protein
VLDYSGLETHNNMATKTVEIEKVSSIDAAWGCGDIST